MRKILALFLAFFLLTGASSQNYNATTSVETCGTADDMIQEDQPLTIVVWVYANGVGEGGTGRIVDRETSGAVFGPHLFLNATASVGFRNENSGGTALDRRTSNSTLTLSAWQSLAVTWDGSTTASNVKIYINLAEPSYKTTTNASAILGDNVLATTRLGNRSGDDRTFDGQIAYVQIWNRVLTTAEISQATYRPGSVRNGLRFYRTEWNNNGADLSGNGHTCTPSNTADSALGPPVFLTTGAT